MFLFRILLKISVQSLRSIVQAILAPELVKCSPLRHLSPAKFLQPTKNQNQILFKHISNQITKFLLKSIHDHIKQIIKTNFIWVFLFFNVIFLLKWSKQEIINKRRQEKARRNIVELKTWLRQKQPPEMFYKKVFLKISQNSQEKTCAGVVF